MMAGECLTQDVVVPPMPMPITPVLEITYHLDGYVMEVKEEASHWRWPEFNPKPEIVE